MEIILPLQQNTGDSQEGTRVVPQVLQWPQPVLLGVLHWNSVLQTCKKLKVVTKSVFTGLKFAELFLSLVFPCLQNQLKLTASH